MKTISAEDAVLSRLAMTIGEPARTRILMSLLDGAARTSTELSAIAEVSAPTTSAHLSKLRALKLVRVAAEGRHRYYSLHCHEVARALESLSVLAGKTTKTFVPSTPDFMRKARSCYDHLAGELAVALHDRFVEREWLLPLCEQGRDGYELSSTGTQAFEELGIDIAQARRMRRRFAYACLDWSERRPHLAGALGAAVFQHALTRKWLTRDLNSRALSISPVGKRDLHARLGLQL